MVIWADPDSIHDKVSTGRMVKEEFDFCELRVKLHEVEYTRKVWAQVQLFMFDVIYVIFICDENGRLNNVNIQITIVNLFIDV